ncbi:hypothetical protein J437_LFUL019768, partial [Ladona fulva]
MKILCMHYSFACFAVFPSIAPLSFGNDVINAGQMVQQTCFVSVGDEPLDISWSINGKEATSLRGVNVVKLGSRTSILMINSVNFHHMGNYTCTAKNPAGTVSVSASLNINVTPYIIPFTLDEEVNSGDSVQLNCHPLVTPYIIPFTLDEEVNSGDSVQLNCHVAKGDKPIHISWNFQGGELSSHMGISTMKAGFRSSILMINSAMAAHSGNYTCTAENKAGVASYTTSLN